jgi:hypothetical protein
MQNMDRGPKEKHGDEQLEVPQGKDNHQNWNDERCSDEEAVALTEGPIKGRTEKSRIHVWATDNPGDEQIDKRGRLAHELE